MTFKVLPSRSVPFSAAIQSSNAELCMSAGRIATWPSSAGVDAPLRARAASAASFSTRLSAAQAVSRPSRPSTKACIAPISRALSASAMAKPDSAVIDRA